MTTESVFDIDPRKQMRWVGWWVFEPRPESDWRSPAEVGFYDLYNRVARVLASPPEHLPSPDALNLTMAYMQSMETIRVVTSNLSNVKYHASRRFLALLDAMERGQHWKDRP